MAFNVLYIYGTGFGMFHVFLLFWQKMSFLSSCGTYTILTRFGRCLAKVRYNVCVRSGFSYVNFFDVVALKVHKQGENMANWIEYKGSNWKNDTSLEVIYKS